MGLLSFRKSFSSHGSRTSRNSHNDNNPTSNKNNKINLLGGSNHSLTNSIKKTFGRKKKGRTMSLPMPPSSKNPPILGSRSGMPSDVPVNLTLPHPRERRKNALSRTGNNNHTTMNASSRYHHHGGRQSPQMWGNSSQLSLLSMPGMKRGISESLENPYLYDFDEDDNTYANYDINEEIKEESYQDDHDFLVDNHDDDDEPIDATMDTTTTNVSDEGDIIYEQEDDPFFAANPLPDSTHLRGSGSSKKKKTTTKTTAPVGSSLAAGSSSHSKKGPSSAAGAAQVAKPILLDAPPSSPSTTSSAASLTLDEINDSTQHTTNNATSFIEDITAGDPSFATPEVTRALVKQFIFEIWNMSNIGLISEVCHPKIRFNHGIGMMDQPFGSNSNSDNNSGNGNPRMGKGIPGLGRAVMALLATLEGFYCEIHSLVVERNKAFARLKFSGRHTGTPLLGYPPSGGHVEWEGATEFTCVDGKILKVWELCDMLALEQQLYQHSSSQRASSEGGAGDDNDDFDQEKNYDQDHGDYYQQDTTGEYR